MSNINWLACKVKSPQQYQKLLADLLALGRQPKQLSGLKDSTEGKLYVVFHILTGFTTDGIQDDSVDNSDVQVFTKRKEFIAEVKRVLGESK